MMKISSHLVFLNNYHAVLLVLSFWFFGVCGVVFIENKIIEISHGDNKVKDSYFGYSLLLQKGLHPIVIVGSPKEDPENGGAVFTCEISKSSKGKCYKYKMQTSNLGHFNGNFLGSVLDGDASTGQSFIACAPKKVTEESDYLSKYYYLKGFCFHHKNSSRLDSDKTSDVEIYPLKASANIRTYHRQNYYDNAYGQAGIDIEYNPETDRVLMGAPGVRNWNGAMVSQSLKNYQDSIVIPRNQIPIAIENNNYLGYAVAIAKISNTMYEVASAPRGDNLNGVVKMFFAHTHAPFRQFKGDEMGGYFGSSLLCSDVTNDGSDDLFVGVPMGKGSTFDEGYVYFYQNAKAPMQKLFGSKKTGARFGSCISALGDIDLDNYNDVAISAPFEDDGIGAVYIYMGEKQGIKNTYSQRLSPLKFDGDFSYIRGFGLGLSKGNDLDGNGHNDFAIGAYKSGRVFVLNSKSVIDVAISLETNVSSITDGKSMSVKYCMSYQQRSKAKNLKSVNFRLFLELDYRAVGVRNFYENVTVSLEKQFCKSRDVTIQQNVVDILPFRITLTSDALGDIIATAEKQITKEIPYSHGCGEDNICQTKLSLNLTLTNPNIVVGLNKEVTVKVSANNTGEPGYQCSLYMNIPDELRLTKGDCKSDNNTFICPFSRKLVSDNKQTKLVFEVISVKQIAKKVDVDFELKCLGENSTPTKQTLSVGVIVRNSPYIEGKPDPVNIYYDDKSADDHEISHTFIVGNSGPSPIKLDVYLLLPMVQYKGNEVFEFVDAEEDRNGFQVQCYPSNETRIYEKKYDVQSIITEPVNSTIVVDCFEEGSRCLEILCQGGYLDKSSEVAKYTVKVKTNTKLLAAQFNSQLKKRSNVAYVASAFLSNSTTRIESHSATMIFSSQKKSVPYWVWILAAVLGILLLVALIYLLKKCHFFDRNYRDKLNDERLLGQQTGGMETVPSDTETVDLESDPKN